MQKVQVSAQDLPADWGELFVDESDAQGYLNSVPCPQGLPPNDYFQGVLVWSPTPAFPVVLAKMKRESTIEL